MREECLTSLVCVLVCSPTAAARDDDVVVRVVFVRYKFLETNTCLIHPVLESIPDDGSFAVGCGETVSTPDDSCRHCTARNACFQAL